MRVFVAVVLVALALPTRAEALDLWRSDDGMRGVELTPSLKLFTFGIAGLLEGPEGLEGFQWPLPNVGGGTLGRLRFRLIADITPRVRAVVHYEHRPRILSHGRLLSSVSSALQGEEQIPFRVTPLQWSIAASDTAASDSDAFLGPESPTFVWEHEIDRLFMSFSLDYVDITVGRQAVGWGISSLWAPLDLFAPMSPTDIDREERRGIDAVKLTLPLNALSHMEVVLTGGQEIDEDGDQELTWQASSLAWLFRANLLSVDWLLVGGKVGRDRVIGAGIAGQVGGILLRGEITGTMDASHDRYIRATVGFEFGTPFGLTGAAEYHFNGFGVSDPADYVERSLELAGKMASGQISGVGRHYWGVTLAWQPSSWGGLALTYVQNLTDGSLTLAPAIQYVISDEVRLSLAAQIPIGRDPRWTTDGLIPQLEPRSEYGLGAQMYVIQVQASI